MLFFPYVVFISFGFSDFLYFYLEDFKRKQNGFVGIDKWTSAFWDLNCEDLDYFTIKIITLIVSIGFYLQYGLSFELFKYVLIYSLFLITTITDLKYNLIPNNITAAGILFGITFLYINAGPVMMFQRINNSIIGLGLLLLLYYIGYGSVGGGDVKLVIATILFVGWQNTLSIIFISVIFAFISLNVKSIKQRKLLSKIALAPYLYVGFIIYQTLYII
jgi:Flp pilus assembly protein protease CpaA